MLEEYERLLVGEMLMEVNTLNAMHLQLFCDTTKQNKEKYDQYKLIAKSAGERIIEIGQRLMGVKNET